LLGKRKMIDFFTSAQDLERIDSDWIQQIILSIPYSEWEQREYSKGTLHYLKQNAMSGKRND
jgi:CRISPR-associated protein Cas1